MVLNTYIYLTFSLKRIILEKDISTIFGFAIFQISRIFMLLEIQKSGNMVISTFLIDNNLPFSN